eukprot:5459644-Pleurochrysis_carterae.AAC.1
MRARSIWYKEPECREGRAGMCRWSVACVRRAGIRGRGDLRDRKRSRIRNGSTASGSRQRRDPRRGAPLSQSCLVPMAMAAPKAATFRRMDSNAQ